MVKQLE
jgi:hypothetical protein